MFLLDLDRQLRFNRHFSGFVRGWDYDDCINFIRIIRRRTLRQILPRIPASVSWRVGLWNCDTWTARRYRKYGTWAAWRRPWATSRPRARPRRTTMRPHWRRTHCWCPPSRRRWRWWWLFARPKKSLPTTGCCSACPVSAAPRTRQAFLSAAAALPAADCRYRTCSGRDATPNPFHPSLLQT